MGWTLRRFAWSLLVIACSDGPGSGMHDASSEGSTSTAPEPTSEGSTESSTTADSTSTSTTEASTGDASTSTGSSVESARARILFARGNLEQDDGVWAIDIVDGVPEPAIQLVDEERPSNTTDDARWRIYGSDLQHPTSMHVVDMHARPATPAVIVDVEDGTGFEVAVVETDAVDSSWVLVRAVDEDAEVARHFSIALEDDGPGTPWPLPFEWGYVEPAIAIAADRVAVVAPGEIEGTQRVVLAPATASAAEDVVEIASGPGPFSIAAVSPDRRLIVFGEGESASLAWFVVDVDADSLDPIELEPPPGETLSSPRFSPTGDAIVVRSTADAGAAEPVYDLLWIPVDDAGVPGSAIPITTGELDDLAVGVTAWSDDGRWLTFRGLGVDDFLDHYLVRVDGTEPGSPVRIEESPVVGPFSRDGKYFYSLTADGRRERLVRFDISGDEPGPAQTVIAGVGTVSWATLSGDGSPMLAVWRPSPTEPLELDLIDVSGDEPAAPIMINAPLGREEILLFARSDAEATVAVYETAEPQSGPRRVYWVDLAGGRPAEPLGDGIDMFAPSLHELPP